MISAIRIQFLLQQLYSGTKAVAATSLQQFFFFSFRYFLQFHFLGAFFSYSAHIFSLGVHFNDDRNVFKMNKQNEASISIDAFWYHFWIMYYYCSNVDRKSAEEKKNGCQQVKVAVITVCNCMKATMESSEFSSQREKNAWR